MDIEKKYQALLEENKQLKVQLDEYREILQLNNLLPKDQANNANITQKNLGPNKYEIINRRLAIYLTLFRGREDVFALR